MAVLVPQERGERTFSRAGSAQSIRELRETPRKSKSRESIYGASALAARGSLSILDGDEELATDRNADDPRRTIRE